MLQTEGAPAGAQAPEIQETAILLVTPGKRLGIVAFFKTAREVRPAIKIVFFGHVFADERNAQSFDNCFGVHSQHRRTCVKLAVCGVPPFDIVLEMRSLFA